MIKSEITLLRLLDHPNVIKYYQTEILPDKSGALIILEYMQGGSIRNLIDNKGAGGRIEEKFARTYMKQVL